MTERQGIEIDYCSTCRGVWLDRGELDKLIERSAAPEAPVARETRPYEPRDEYHDHGRKPHHKRKEGLLGELFDF